MGSWECSLGLCLEGLARASVGTIIGHTRNTIQIAWDEGLKMDGHHSSEDRHRPIVERTVLATFLGFDPDNSHIAPNPSPRDTW